MTTNKKPERRPVGRPALPPGAGKAARVEWRTTPERKVRAQQLAAAAGMSVSAWFDQVVDQALL